MTSSNTGLWLLLGACFASGVIANIPLGPVHFPPLGEWVIKEGLMSVFFFVVGLDIKKAITTGSLSTPKKMVVPLMGAIGGMVVPALLYAWVTIGSPWARMGWGIPMATDIAFTLGILKGFRKIIPATLETFVSALAILDDLGAILVMTLYYGQGGIHLSAIAVIVALCIPSKGRQGGSMVQWLEKKLLPFTHYIVLPLFAFATAGLSFQHVSLSMLSAPVSIGIMAGLVIGKPLGIVGSVWLGVRFGKLSLPEGTKWVHLWGVSCLCGIGFTMSLFMSQLAFFGKDVLIDEAKIGIFVGSIVSVGLGYVIFVCRGGGKLTKVTKLT